MANSFGERSSRKGMPVPSRRYCGYEKRSGMFTTKQVLPKPQ